ncbi:recombinase family protein [Paraburkholderia sp.]|uniref:recombinase family protein n=1 Tax=Paraburkholderia sp. TaxID=1926495 RepID=UPI0025DF85F8|nr:recombinase family protein [Paraburkholderia sp.]
MSSKSNIAYFRVSSRDQSTDAQRHAMAKGGLTFDKEFSDEGVSGAVPARERPGFAKLMEYVRDGDTVHVYAVDRLGRDAIDVQTTVRELLRKGVAVEVLGLGRIAQGVGELILAVLAQVADMERNRIAERTAAGREKAREAGVHMGRPASIEGERAAEALRMLADTGNVTRTAEHFGISRQALLRLRDSDSKHAVTARSVAAKIGLGPHSAGEAASGGAARIAADIGIGHPSAGEYAS